MTAAVYQPRVARPRLRSVSCSRRPICPCEILPAGLPGRVEINGGAYDLAYHAGLPAVGEPVIYGYRLDALASGQSYDIDADTLECDCPDSIYARVQCKHSLAVARLRLEHRLA